MTAITADSLASGKGHRDENFPVASFVLKRDYRAPIMAYYRFARAADDVADNAEASADERIGLLRAMRATLDGRSDADANSLALRRVCEERGLSTAHGLDLLTAFERDCTQHRHADWASLLDYCRYSAMPVGRFVLDVHGEAQSTWPANDALCAALQIINHAQDCGKDYRTIDRVYLPLDLLASEGVAVEALAAPAASPALRRVIVAVAERTDTLLAEAARFAPQIRDRRLRMEVAAIHALAVSLNDRLKRRDPLSERVHHGKAEAAGIAALAALGAFFR